MFFTKAGFVVAWLMFFLGVIGLVISILSAWLGFHNEAGGLIRRGNLASIDFFLLTILIAIALGIAVEISQGIADKNE